FAPLFLIASPATPDVLILPAMLAANIAQGAAAMAVSAKAKDKNLKQVALAAGISALLAGVTEPALYGVTLKYKKPLYAAMIAGGICGIFMGITGVESYAFAVPSLVAIPQFINGTIDSNFINACIVAAASIGITFALTWFFGFEEELTTEDAVLEVVSSGSSDPKKVLAPVKGKVIPLEKVNDSAFSSKVMGEGIAIIPEENTIVAPFDGTVSAIFPTKHAVGLTSDAGMELLIHVGIDTVELNGQYFESLVSVGDLVKAGQALLTVDFGAVKAAGYDPVVPIVVTNSETFIDVVPKDEMQSANYDDAVLYVI
ncbi:MAG: glucose PTS transporter subunit IIA, partial [Enterococcus gilvus]